VGLLPHKRALVERLKDEPFSFVGMYGRSGVPAEIAARLKSENVTWRNGMDLGEAPDCLWSTWAVRGFPQFYLIDDQGVIRGRWFGDPGDELERGIEALLAELRARAK
jgi:hypothetical protein